MSEVRNIKDGLVDKVVEDFTDYAIHLSLIHISEPTRPY